MIPIGVCHNGNYSKGLRGKDAVLDAACINKCFRSKGYPNGMCPSNTDTTTSNKNTSGCPPECYREAQPAIGWTGAVIQFLIMVRTPRAMISGTVGIDV